jgi:hypothetical protein
VPRAPIAGLLLAAACSETSFDVSFPDELSGAPARQIEVIATDGTCREALWTTHAEVAAGADATVRLDLPLDTGADPLGALSSDRPSTLVVAALDGSGMVVARGCERLDGPERDVRVPLSLAPRCDDAPVEVDVALVIDASQAMQLADVALDGGVRAAISEDFLQAELPWGASVIYAATDDYGEALPVLTPQEVPNMAFGGGVNVYSPLFAATRFLRDEARCAAVPVLLAVVAGGPDGWPDGAAYARVALEGAQTDPSDDIFTYGIALDGPGLALLQDGLPAEARQLVGPLRTLGALSFQLGEARVAFSARR